MTYLEHLKTPEDLPMSDEQTRLLWLLCKELDLPSAYDPRLSFRRAASEIIALEDELRMRLLPPHTD
ncbi:MAG: hypothetical protein ACRCS0_06065 [Albidovulum sp.]